VHETGLWLLFANVIVRVAMETYKLLQAMCMIHHLHQWYDVLYIRVMLHM